MIKLDVSISIVTYNANMSMLSLTLNKLKGAVDFISDNDVEINTVLTLIDHSPFPDSMVQSDSVFQCFGCGSKLINDPLNPGFGAGHNRALLSDTKYHLILNPDLEVAPDALKNALEFMERHPECGLLTPFATWADGEVQRLCKGYPTVFDLLLRGFAPAFVKKLFQTRLAKYEMADQLNNHDVLWDPPIVSGCFMLFRTDVLQQLEGIGAVDHAMKVSLAIKVVNLLVIILTVSSPDDFDIVMASLCIPMLFGGIYLSYFASMKYHVAFPTFNRLGKSLYDGRDVFIGLLAPNFYNAIPTIALGSMYPPAEFANFAIATRLVAVIITVQNVIAKAVYPVVAMLKSNQVNKLLTVNFVVSIIPSILLYNYGEWVLSIFLGKEFSSVNSYLVILSVGVIFIGLSNSISQGYILPNGYDRIYRNISLRVSILAAIISVVSIYFYGLVGGAFAMTFARTLFFIDYWIVYSKIVLGE
ncbi:hypothetical protein [Aeromonas caviae]|uniref:hypothetical protein n=1 Tax=Aeromonas caviae TaxID=648 RepID=UPI002B4642E0|nr:hypothetical protein [Aeromonas caviae]